MIQDEAAEVVVIDDGSTDGTADAARAADDGSGRLRIIGKANGGPGSAVNCGRDATTSPYFCVLDSDDFMLPGRLARIFEEAGDRWDMAADRLLLAEEPAQVRYQFWRGQPPASGVIGFADFVRGNITNPRRPRTELGYLQPLYRRAFMDAHEVRHTGSMWLGEDFFVYSTALARGAVFKVTPSFGYVAVAQPNSLSRRHSTRDLELLLEADWRLMREAGLKFEDVFALRDHMRHLEQKIAYRKALDAKAAGDLAGALKLSFADRRTFLYICDQTLRAKTAKAAQLCGVSALQRLSRERPRTFDRPVAAAQGLSPP